MHILYVENHERFAQIAVAHLLAEHEVTVTPTVAQARRWLERESFDALLIDYDLDDGKGTELLLTLPPLMPRPCIVAVSSHDAGNAALARAGADAACRKSEFHRIAAILSDLRPAGISR